MTSWPGAASLMSYASESAFLQLRPRLDPGADLLGEDQLALRGGERVELGLEFLPRAWNKRAYPIRIGLLEVAAGAAWAGGPGFHGHPGARSSGTGLRVLRGGRGRG